MKKFFALGLICLLAICLVLVSGCKSSTPSENSTNSVSTPVLVSKSQNLVNGVITVSANGYYDKSFSVTSAMQQAKVVGSFQASGGSGNDVEVYIFDDISLTNWENGHQVSAFYNSDRITIANIAVSLSPGKYHLVLSNKFSIFTSKQVTTTVNLNWSELK